MNKPEPKFDADVVIISDTIGQEFDRIPRYQNQGRTPEEDLLETLRRNITVNVEKLRKHGRIFLIASWTIALLLGASSLLVLFQSGILLSVPISKIMVVLSALSIAEKALKIEARAERRFATAKKLTDLNRRASVLQVKLISQEITSDTLNSIDSLWRELDETNLFVKSEETKSKAIKCLSINTDFHY